MTLACATHTTRELWPRFPPSFASPAWLTDTWVSRARCLLEKFFSAEGVEPIEAEGLAAEAVVRLAYRGSVARSPTAQEVRRIVTEVLSDSRPAKAPLAMPLAQGPTTATFEDIEEVRAIFLRAPLSLRQRRIIGYCLRGWPRPEIVAVTGLTPQTVHRLLHSAVHRLRQARAEIGAQRPQGNLEWEWIADAVLLKPEGPPCVRWITTDGETHQVRRPSEAQL